MKKTFAYACSVLCLLGFSALALAGHDGDRRGHHGMMFGEMGNPDRMLEHMVRRLDLDENQEQKIGNILSAASPEAEVLRERGRTTREAIAALDTSDPDYNVKIQDLALEVGEIATAATLLHGRVRAEVAAELTDEQVAELAEGRARMHERFGRHRKRHGKSAETSE